MSNPKSDQPNNQKVDKQLSWNKKAALAAGVGVPLGVFAVAAPAAADSASAESSAVESVDFGDQYTIAEMGPAGDFFSRSVEPPLVQNGTGNSVTTTERGADGYSVTTVNTPTQDGFHKEIFTSQTGEDPMTGYAMIETIGDQINVQVSTSETEEATGLDLQAKTEGDERIVVVDSVKSILGQKGSNKATTVDEIVHTSQRTVQQESESGGWESLARVDGTQERFTAENGREERDYDLLIPSHSSPELTIEDWSDNNTGLGKDLVALVLDKEADEGESSFNLDRGGLASLFEAPGAWVNNDRDPSKMLFGQMAVIVPTQAGNHLKAFTEEQSSAGVTLGDADAVARTAYASTDVKQKSPDGPTETSVAASTLEESTDYIKSLTRETPAFFTEIVEQADSATMRISREGTPRSFIFSTGPDNSFGLHRSDFDWGSGKYESVDIQLKASGDLKRQRTHGNDSHEKLGELPIANTTLTTDGKTFTRQNTYAVEGREASRTDTEKLDWSSGAPVLMHSYAQVGLSPDEHLISEAGSLDSTPATFDESGEVVSTFEEEGTISTLTLGSDGPQLTESNTGFDTQAGPNGISVFFK